MEPSGNQTKLKILVVHEINYREKVIYEIHEFPELLAEAGHEVEFLEFAEGYTGKPGKNERTWVQSGRVYKNAKLRIHSPWLSGIENLDRLVGLATVFRVLWSIRKSKFDVILNFAVPTYGLQVLLFGWLTKTPVVHRALDVSHKIRKSPWNPAISLVERLVFNFSTSLSANNPAMADYIRSKLWRSIPVSVNLPPSLSPGMRQVEFDEPLASELGITKDDFVIVYLGSFFYFSGLDAVIRGLAEARKTKPHLRLLLVGGGEQEVQLRNLCKELALEEEVVFTGFVPFEDIPRYVSLADVAINPMEVSAVSSFALPNKVIQYLSLNKPVVSTILEGLRSVFERFDVITWVGVADDVVSACINQNLQTEEKANESQRLASVAQFDPQTATDSLIQSLLTVRNSLVRAG